MPLVVTKISRGSTFSHRVELLKRRLHGLEEDDPDDYNHAAAWDLNVEIADLLKDEEDNFEKAIRYYKKALFHAAQDKTHKIDHRDRADVLCSLSTCCQRTNDFTQAFRYGQEHLKLAQSADDIWEQVKAHQSLGDTLLHEGESIEDEEEAMTVFKHASSQYEAVKTLLAKLQEGNVSEDPSEEQLQTQSMFTRLNSGIIYTKLKIFSNADSDLTMALTFCKDLGDLDNERNIYMNMAALAEASGVLDKVTNYQQIELDFVRQHELEGEIDCLMDMARVYRLRGMNDKCIETCREIQDLSDDPETLELAEEHIREIMEESRTKSQEKNSIDQSQPLGFRGEYSTQPKIMDFDELESESASQTKSSTLAHHQDIVRQDRAPRRRLFRKEDTALNKLSDEITCVAHLEVDSSANIADVYRFGFQLLEPQTLSFPRIDFNNVGWLKRTIQRRFQDRYLVRLDIGSATVHTSETPLLDTELLETIVKDSTSITLNVNGIEHRPLTDVYKEACQRVALYPQELLASILVSAETSADFRFSSMVFDATCKSLLGDTCALAQNSDVVLYMGPEKKTIDPSAREYTPILQALLQGPSSLTIINLSNGALDDSAADVLSQLLYSPTIKELLLASNKLTSKGLKRCLSPWLFADDAAEPSWFYKLPKSGLETFNISFNPLGGGSGLEHIAQCVNRFPALKKLDLSCCQLSLTAMSVAMEDWEKIEQLETTLHRGLEVSMARNNFSTEGMLLWLQRAAPNLICVDSLDLSSMRVGEGWSGLSFLCSILRLRRLNLNNCDIGLTGAKSLAVLLKKSVFLETLELRHAQLDSRAIGVLSEGIAANTSLRSLDLSGNPIGSFGALVPSSAVSSQATQQDHQYRPGTFHLAAALQRHLEARSSRQLERLVLADCQLQLQDCAPLFHTALHDLSLAHNPLLSNPEDVDQLMSLVVPLTLTTASDQQHPLLPPSLKRLDLSWTFSPSSLASGQSDMASKIQELTVSWQTDTRRSGGLGPGSSVQGPILVLVTNPLPAMDAHEDMDVDL